MRQAAAALFVLTLCAGGGPAVAGDPAEIARARDRHAIVDQMKRSVTGSSVANAIVALPDPTTAVLAGADCIVIADDAVRDAIARRDAQGRDLYAYYKAHYATRSEPTDKEIATYDALAVVNRTLCKTVRERERDLVAVQRAERTVGARVAGDDAAMTALANALRSVTHSAHSSTTLARLFESLTGAYVQALQPDLEKSALKGASRDERVEALRCLAQLGVSNHADVLAPCLGDADPYVRRATFPVFAAMLSKDAVDALVARMARETGVPARELATALGRLTGQQFGDLGKAWADWWAGARDAWDGPPAVAPPAPKAGQPATRYFGLDIRSMRVLFVLDRSWSMECGVGYDGVDDMKLFDGDSKIVVARRELIQAITGLADGASFDVVAFGSSTKSYAPKLVEATPENRHKAIWWVEHLELDGSTNMGGAMIDAFESMVPTPRTKDSEIADTIVVLTDGVPNCGPIGHEDDVLDEVRRRNSDRTVTIHAVYLGNEGNVEFMKRLAEDNGGQFVHRAK